MSTNFITSLLWQHDRRLDGTCVCRRFCDPKLYRIICFDQRGCGQSTPQGCLIDNSTRHLVEDIEKLRTHLNVDSWMVFGGSWGVALSLAYAITHPKRCDSMRLGGPSPGQAADSD